MDEEIEDKLEAEEPRQDVQIGPLPSVDYGNISFAEWRHRTWMRLNGLE